MDLLLERSGLFMMIKVLVTWSGLLVHLVLLGVRRLKTFAFFVDDGVHENVRFLVHASETRNYTITAMFDSLSW